MKEFLGVKDIKEPLQRTIVTIGNFDGVHKGHQELMSQVLKKAAEINAETIAVTFDPHPLKCIRPENTPPIITLHEQKKELIEKTGIENLLTINFSKKFAAMSAVEFIEQVFVKKLNAKAIIVGQDYRFGKDRHGDIELLKEYGEKYGYEVILPQWVTFEDKRISSTLVRQSVQEGNLDQAKLMLGRYYQIRGKVVHGRNRGGKKLGFPTANIELADELCPKMGVYAVTAEIEKKLFHGVANIGYSPTFEDYKFTVEVHIIDFDKDIYEENIRVNFVKRLRGEIKFSGLDQLSAQIKKDVRDAKTILSEIQ